MLAARLAPAPAAPAEQHKKAAGAMTEGPGGIGDFLSSRQGQQLQREVIRGVFGLLKKRI
jgi:hypothetical protein